MTIFLKTKKLIFMKTFNDLAVKTLSYFPQCLILILIISLFSCSQNSSKKQSSSQRLESLKKEIDSLAKANDFKKIQPLIIKLNTLKWEVILQNPFWKGRPYEKILQELSKQNILMEYQDFAPASTDTNRTILEIFPYNNDLKNLNRVKWNMEDVNNIKKTIMNTLKFEPEVDSYGTLVWTASKYDIEVSETGSNDIRIQFLTKEK